MTKVEDLLDRHKKLKARRQEWDDWFQALAEVFLPNQADFTTGVGKGKRRDTQNYENSHRMAARNFAATVGGLAMPETPRDISFTVGGYSPPNDDEVKLWMDDTADRMWRAIHATSARFKQAKAETETSLVVLGTGCFWISENRTRDGLMFKSFHLKDAAIDENSAGQVDTLALSTNLTKRQAIQRFGEENLGKKTLEDNSARGTYEKKHEFVQIILPNDDRDARKINNANMPFASVVIDVDSEHIISQSGFNEFPAAVPRWETSPEEVYGRSPAMMAYADTKTLQSIARTLLIAGQRAVDPPKWVSSDAAIAGVRTFPGGLTPIDHQSLVSLGGRPPIGVLEMGGQIPLGREMQDDYRQLVQRAFFQDLFINYAALQGRAMTATEILERKEELVRVLGATFGRLEPDYTGVTMNRVFRIMDRAGAFLPRPEAIQDEDMNVTYTSAFQRARKATEAAGLSRTFEVLIPAAQINEEAATMLDHFDWDEIARDTPEWAGYPHRYLKTKDRVDEDRQARQQQIAEAAALQQAQQAGVAVRDFALAEQAGADAAEVAG